MKTLKPLNNVTCFKGIVLPLYTRLQLMYRPLHLCNDIPIKLPKGAWIYRGSHHFAVVSKNGARLILVAQK